MVEGPVRSHTLSDHAAGNDSASAAAASALKPPSIELGERDIKAKFRHPGTIVRERIGNKSRPIGGLYATRAADTEVAAQGLLAGSRRYLLLEPRLERRDGFPHFRFIAVTLIQPDNSGAAPRYVIDQRFNDLQPHTEPLEVCGIRASCVV